MLKRVRSNLGLALGLMLAAALMGHAAYAQTALNQVATAPHAAPPSNDDDAAQSMALVNRLDSLVDAHAFSFKNRALENKKLNKYNFNPGDVPIYTDSVYAARLASIESGIPFDYNEHVKGFINLYTVRKRHLSERVMGLGSYYFPIFEEVFEKENLPHSFKYLAIVESALNPNAVSPMGATGIWQFMLLTGRQYSLDVNYYVDERRDPYKATLAAAEYFKDMYAIYHDWHLVLAAYNCGPGNVNRALRKAGGKGNFWTIYPYLPKETRSYVPAFIAAAYMMEFGPEHNLYPSGISLPYATDTILVQGPLPFNEIADAVGVSTDALSAMNPGMKKQYIPQNGHMYTLHIPAKSVATWEANRGQIYARLNRERKPQTDLVAEVNADSTKAAELLASAARNPSLRNAPTGAETGPVPEKPAAAARASQSKLAYTVKRGDNLKLISDLYGVDTDALREWNNLRSSTVFTGQRLSVYVPVDLKKKLAAVNTMTSAQKREALGMEPEAKPATATAKAPAKAPKKKEVAKAPAKKVAPAAQAKVSTPTSNYVVKQGDTMWSISRGKDMSVEELKRLNGINDARDLQPGQVLKVKKG